MKVHNRTVNSTLITFKFDGIEKYYLFTSTESYDNFMFSLTEALLNFKTCDLIKPYCFVNEQQMRHCFTRKDFETAKEFNDFIRSLNSEIEILINSNKI